LVQRAWTPALPILAWASEHREGLIIIDSGETARTSQPATPYYRSAVRLSVDPDQEIGPRCAAAA
jgi:hypothetical protein